MIRDKMAALLAGRRHETGDREQTGRDRLTDGGVLADISSMFGFVCVRNLEMSRKNASRWCLLLRQGGRFALVCVGKTTATIPQDAKP